MKTIWKFPLDVCERQFVAMPKGAKILSVDDQYGFGCLWAIVDPSASTVDRAIVRLGTGEQFNDDPGIFVGTYQQGPLVWHVFDAGEKTEEKS